MSCAIAHKDYAAANPIQISVYHDKLMIWNAGCLPEGWTLDHLTGKHTSSPFNPDIANAFFRTAYLESWGRGIELIISACLAHGCPAPKLRWDNGLWVEFPFAPQDGAEPREKPREKPREHTGEKILWLIADDPEISMQDLATSVGITHKGVEWQIRKLKAQGRLRRVGPARGGHWEVVP